MCHQNAQIYKGTGTDSTISRSTVPWLPIFSQGGVARTGDDTMGKDGDGKMLEIVREAKVAAVEKGAGLRSALEHGRAARTDAESELLVLRVRLRFPARSRGDGVDFDVGDGVLHGDHFTDVRQGRVNQADVSHRPCAEFPFGFVRGSHLDAHEKRSSCDSGEIGAVVLDRILRGETRKG